MALAFTRPPSPQLGECELTHMERAPISADLAAKQHRTYEELLANAGFDVVQLKPLAEHPDGVFVEDTAILLGDHAIITRPGTPSRRAEADDTAATLAKHFTVHRLRRGRLDGGDVLKVGKQLFVGLSSRTDSAGAIALANLAAPLGYEVIGVPHKRCLHLKTGASYAGRDDRGREVVLLNPDWIDPEPFSDHLVVPNHPLEPYGANVLRAGGALLVPADAPRTAQRLRTLGFETRPVDVGELQKAEAGLTCMSLIAE
ncbi:MULTISPECIES: dimethylarginine dimethylaminohydrolase family protein [Sphingomonas]|uniref:dimethylarginine dimethylaminohydrolase family protein n=1 Tax=Sphingomonas TaxID=13687 RepID=UPI000DEFBFC9|nr:MULTISPECIES: arginine deiminase family protein [Sphingomonas]